MDYYLRKHPEIELGKKKELHFFDNEEVFNNPVIDYSLLQTYYTQAENKLYGEATPIYIYWTPTIRRIWEYNKGIKLIAILRNPISRAFSQWNMEYQLKKEDKLFMDSIKSEAARAKEVLPLQHRVCSYVDRGFYSEQIRRIKRFFPDEQVLFIKYEDYLMHQESTIHKVLNFLGLSTDNYSFEYRLVHKRYSGYSITEQERAYLKQIYINDIKEVERILGWNCSDWLA